MEIIIKPNLAPIFKPLLDSQYKEGVIVGGRAKGATQAVSKVAGCWIMQSQRGVIIRNEANKIEESIFLPVKDWLLNIEKQAPGAVLNRFSLHDLNIKDKSTNQNAVFLKGVRASTAEDTDVFKGLEGLDFAIIEEAQQIRSGVAIQKLLDTGIRFPNFKLVMLLNTPDAKDHWIIKKYFELENSEIEGFFKLVPKQLKNTIQIVASYKDNPYLAPEAVEQYENYEHTEPQWFYHQILGLVPKDTGSRSIVKRSHKASWRDSDDVVYTINHTFIKRSMQEEGFFFLAFDGGEHTNRKAAVLGCHIKRFKRDILLKEFFNELDIHDLREVAMQAREFIELHNLKGEIRLYGDPTIFNDGVHHLIESVFDKKLNALQHFLKSPNAMFRELYQHRKKKRLARLGTDMFELCSDNKPRIIILKDLNQGFGCPRLYKGLFDGLYRYELDSRNEPTEDIEQFKEGDNKHLTDICDAYTYFILAERPFSAIEKTEEQRRQNKVMYDQARVGWS